MNLNRAEMIKAELLVSVERLGGQLPPNTLDQLIAELGGPENVAEVGRFAPPFSNIRENSYPFHLSI